MTISILSLFKQLCPAVSVGYAGLEPLDREGATVGRRHGGLEIAK
jgi:hypothetical protein